jgi:hypothetical protein
MRRLAVLPGFAARSCFHSHVPPNLSVYSLAKTPNRYLNTGGLTNLFDEAQAPALQIRNVSDRGIELEDGLVYASACILLGGQSFSWKVPGQPWVGWSSEAFEIFNVVSPKPGQSLFTALLLRNRPLISRP